MTGAHRTLKTVSCRQGVSVHLSVQMAVKPTNIIAKCVGSLQSQQNIVKSDCGRLYFTYCTASRLGDG